MADCSLCDDRGCEFCPRSMPQESPFAERTAIEEMLRGDECLVSGSFILLMQSMLVEFTDAEVVEMFRGALVTLANRSLTTEGVASLEGIRHGVRKMLRAATEGMDIIEGITEGGER